MCGVAHTCELQGQSLLLSSCVILGKSLHLSDLSFFICKLRLLELWVGFNRAQM